MSEDWRGPAPGTRVASCPRSSLRGLPCPHPSRPNPVGSSSDGSGWLLTACRQDFMTDAVAAKKQKIIIDPAYHSVILSLHELEGGVGTALTQRRGSCPPCAARIAHDAGGTRQDAPGVGEICAKLRTGLAGSLRFSGRPVADVDRGLENRIGWRIPALLGTGRMPAGGTFRLPQLPRDRRSVLLVGLGRDVRGERQRNPAEPVSLPDVQGYRPINGIIYGVIFLAR